MQLGTRQGAAPEMCPDKLTQFSPDRKRQQTMGLWDFPILARCVSTHITFSLRRRKQQQVHQSSPALFIQLNNSSVPVSSQQLAGVGFLLCPVPTMSTATHLHAPQQRRGFLDIHGQTPSPHPIPSHAIPSHPSRS